MNLMNAGRAYGLGFAASRRTDDLDAAESRFIKRHGSKFVNAFLAGWTDYAVDETNRVNDWK